MVQEAADNINKALTALSQSNIVSANNAQPLQAVITAIDVNLTDLVSLFTDGITKQRVTESNPSDSTLERQQSNVIERQSPVVTIAPAPIERVQMDVISSHSIQTPEVPPGFSALQNQSASTSSKATTRATHTKIPTKKSPQNSRRSRRMHIPNKRYAAQASQQWYNWAKCDGVELDSQGTPFFTANTAIDLDASGKKLNYRSAIAGKDSSIWLKEHGIEISRLIDTETINPIYWNKLPQDKKPAYYNPQVRTKVKDGILQYRVRGTIGGDRILYSGDKQAFTATMQTIKLLLNATVSERAKFMTADIKNFYLGTPLPDKEYMTV